MGLADRIGSRTDLLMEQVHVLADHGAWMLYLAGAAYGILPSLQWLLASQALALSRMAVPICGWRSRRD